MAKTSRKSATSKKLEALARAQKISELLKIGGIQSQALLDSAGETRSSDESHVVDLLNSGTFGRGSEASSAPARASRPAKAKKAKQKPRPKAHHQKKHSASRKRLVR